MVMYRTCISWWCCCNHDLSWEYGEQSSLVSLWNKVIVHPGGLMCKFLQKWFLYWHASHQGMICFSYAIPYYIFCSEPNSDEYWIAIAIMFYFCFRELPFCFLGCLELWMDPQFLCKTPGKPYIIWMLYAYLKQVLWTLIYFCRENAGLLALTRVGSRRVVQISAGFMIFFSILGKK